MGSPPTPVRMGVYVWLLCFGVAGVKYPAWAPHCLRDCETDPHIALKSSCVWGFTHDCCWECVQVLCLDFRYWNTLFCVYSCVSVCVCVCMWKCVPPSCVSPGGPVLLPDRQNTECPVIKEQRNDVRGSHAASAYHIITDRQREEGCRFQFKHCSPVGLHCSWGSRITRLLMVNVGVAGRDEQHERRYKVLDFSLLIQVQTTCDMVSLISRFRFINTANCCSLYPFCCSYLWL